MKNYIVLYRNNNIGYNEEPFGFSCMAEDIDHAEEQCLNAEPDAEIEEVMLANDYYNTYNI